MRDTVPSSYFNELNSSITLTLSPVVKQSLRKINSLYITANNGDINLHTTITVDRVTNTHENDCVAQEQKGLGRVGETDMPHSEMVERDSAVSQ